MSIIFQYPKGRVKAHGYFFDHHIKTDELKQRILKLWTKHSQFYKLNKGYILLQAVPEYVFVEQCLGSPLLKQHNTFCNVIISHAGNIFINQDKKSVNLVQSGLLQTHELTTEKLIDPANWVDLRGISEQKTQTLGSLSKPHVKKYSHQSTIREVLKDKGLKNSAEAKKVLQNLKQISEGREKRDITHRSGIKEVFKGLLHVFRFKASEDKTASNRSAQINRNKSHLVLIANGLSRFLHMFFKKSQSNPAYQLKYSNINSGGLFKKIKIMLTNMIRTSALGKAIGKQQAKHIQKIMDQMHRGDLDAALNNAIPLSNLKDALDQKQSSLLLKGGSLPDSIQPYAQRRGGSVGLDDNLFYQLEQMYKRAFNTLDKAGNYKKAAFVLAELLRDIDKAVAYLEKHKQFTLAAELAEGQKLEPSRIIRQWILAKNIDRAMNIAIIAGCYQEAITALQNNHKEHAFQLRVICANLHYKSGNIDSAVDIIWPVNNQRVKAIEWLKESVELGGEIGARHLLKLYLYEEASDTYLMEINRLLHTKDSSIGLALLDEIISLRNQPKIKRIASLMTRYYLSEVAKGQLAFDRKRWDQLCVIAEDLTLRADIKGLDFKLQEIKKSKEPLELCFAKTFGRQAQDCAVLLDGKILLAFGEAGVELWNSKGQQICHFAISCHRIVISEHKNKALLVSARSGYQIVHKFDLKTQTVDHWLDLDIHCWADNYDGHLWVVAHENTIYILDTHDVKQSALWSVNKLPGKVTIIKKSSESFAVSLVNEKAFEIWVYRLPNLYLKERTPHQQEKLEDFEPQTMNEKGIVVGLKTAEQQAFALYHCNNPIDWHEFTQKRMIDHIAFYGDHLYIHSSDDENNVLDIFPIVKKKIASKKVSIRFNGLGKVFTKVHGDNMLVHHSEGRIVVINLSTGKVMNDFIC